MSYSTRAWKKFLNDNSFDLLTEARIKDVKVKYPHWNTWNVIDLFVRELTKRNILKLKRKNFFYVFSAKKGLFNTPFKELEKEFRELVIKK